MGQRQQTLQVLPQGVVVLAEQPLAFEQGLEPLGKLALKNARQLDDQLVQLGQLGHALLQLVAGSRQGHGQLRGWGLGQARTTPDPWRWLFLGGGLFLGGWLVIRGGLFLGGWLSRGGWLFLGGGLVRGGWRLQGTGGQEHFQSSPGPGPFGA